MKLTDRIDAARGVPAASPTAEPAQAPVAPAAVTPIEPAPAPPVARPATPATRAPVEPRAAAGARDALADLKERAAQQLFERISSRLNDSSLSEERLHAYARSELLQIVTEEQVPLSSGERANLIKEIGADVLGFGPLELLLDDPSVTEIMVNGPDQVYVERDGHLTLSGSRFTSEAQLRRVIERIVSKVGRRIDESSPLVDARLPDGSRVNAIIPPLAVNGSSLTIRKFSREPLTVSDLMSFGTLTQDMAAMLEACVLARLNIIVSGGTGTGKTTLLNVLSGFIPEEERIVTIEDAVELQLQQVHVVRLESRPSNIEGKGEITIRDLVRNSLRMRPDRIIIGECRGGETLDMLQAMNTGHEGSISTVHANAPRDAIARMETLVLMAGMDLPLRAVREQIASAIDVIVQISRLRDGTRRITHITEVQGMEGDIVTLQEAFAFDYSAGVDDNGRFLGHAVATGVRPRFADRFRDLGIPLSPSIFSAPLTTRGAR
ncbi:MAG: pilus assembly protein CpaF [Rhodoglobus sp.]|nr:pilus assembly protein CpaF [Rhodoglobus sp.]